MDVFLRVSFWLLYSNIFLDPYHNLFCFVVVLVVALAQTEFVGLLVFVALLLDVHQLGNLILRVGQDAFLGFTVLVNWNHAQESLHQPTDHLSLEVSHVRFVVVDSAE